MEQDEKFDFYSNDFRYNFNGKCELELDRKTMTRFDLKL